MACKQFAGNRCKRYNLPELTRWFDGTRFLPTRCVQMIIFQRHTPYERVVVHIPTKDTHT